MLFWSSATGIPKAVVSLFFPVSFFCFFIFGPLSLLGDELTFPQDGLGPCGQVKGAKPPYADDIMPSIFGKSKEKSARVHKAPCNYCICQEMALYRGRQI
jgi:hypothetical protein